MSIKIFCDRCGSCCIPGNSVTYISLRCMEHEFGNDYELCEQCADELKQWINGKDWENDE